MSTFYLLPPVALLADHLAGCLKDCFPGIELTVAQRTCLCTRVVEELENDNVFLVHRDELPAGERAEQALVDGFGAISGDEIVEVRPAARNGEFASRRWRIG
jgi:hypothetical protein